MVWRPLALTGSVAYYSATPVAGRAPGFVDASLTALALRFVAS
ncbi:MAG TPA: hypothetical protein VIB47_02470 [Dehalococcoidia bacterium]